MDEIVTRFCENPVNDGFGGSDEYAAMALLDGWDEGGG
jgi:hypothetical protein